jgi:uncharacterized protein YidB (DUF937 family)
MSLLGDLAKSALGNVLGGQTAQPQAAAGSQDQMLQIAAGLLQQAGGIEGLMAKFQQAGLGDKVASWVGSGSNLPVSADQIQQVLGEHVEAASQQSGHDAGAIAGGLASVLPGLIDHLTPKGESVKGALLEQGLQMALKSGMLGKILG